jgi:hypothetical protein
MTVKGHVALLVVTLAGVAVAVLLIRLVVRDIARPFHWAGADIRSNDDQLHRRAAAGLDAAKEGGRNRVVAGPPAAVGSPTPVGENGAR